MALPTSRNLTYTGATPVRPGDLNDIQDAIIAAWLGKHGDKVLNIPGNACVASAVGGTISQDAGFAESDAAADIIVPIPLREGDRIKSVTFRIAGDGVADVTLNVNKVSAAGADVALLAPLVVNNQNGVVTAHPMNVADTTLVAGDTIRAVLQANAANIRFHGLFVTFDHP